jgi:hypothetical protein
VARSLGRGLPLLTGALAFLLSGALGPAVSVAAVGSAPAPPPTGAGVDISYPQCVKTSHAELPANLPFAIIGLNGGVASNSNPCFLSEYNSALLLAGTTEQPHAAIYVNTGDPALAGLWWPSSDQTQSGTAVDNPDGPCVHLAGAACAYVYGYSMAEADYRRAHSVLKRVPSEWWLDVETSNTWQADVGANAADLTGMVDYFQSKGLSIGIYSTSYQWGIIAGSTEPASPLGGLASGLAGASMGGSPIDCELPPLTPNGRVAMIQYVTNLDNDYSCRRFNASAAVTPSIPIAIGTPLVATSGTWAPGDVSYSYQWNRNGVAIAGAVSSSYVPTAADSGCTVWVTITGTRPGYSTVAQTSNGVSVLGTLIPAPVAITGTPSVGQTLTASTVPWAPAQVSLSYRWYRGNTQISGATAATYELTTADVGQLVTVTVTGSEIGFAPFRESAVSARVAS